MSDEIDELREALEFLADNSMFGHDWHSGHCLWDEYGNTPIPEHLLKVFEPWLEKPGPMPVHGPRKPAGLGWYPSEQSRERDIRQAQSLEAMMEGVRQQIASGRSRLTDTIKLTGAMVPVSEEMLRDEA